ncbi:MAG TPA: hypothetical protein VEI02_06130, partial [Planctomycetota bacterium]|nr:hypothetical protein [Planctomycetota bacterium]
AAATITPEVIDVRASVDEAWVCVAWTTPWPADAEWPAVHAVASRLQSHGFRGRRFETRWAPLDQPGLLAMARRLGGEDDPAAAARDLVALAAAAAEALDAADLRTARTGCRAFLDAGRGRDAAVAANPYLAAFSLARTPSFGVDLDALHDAFGRLTAAEARRAAAAVLAPGRVAAVVVRSRTAPPPKPR